MRPSKRRTVPTTQRHCAHIIKRLKSVFCKGSVSTNSSTTKAVKTGLAKIVAIRIGFAMSHKDVIVLKSGVGYTVVMAERWCRMKFVLNQLVNATDY